MDFNEIIETYVNGNITHACININLHGAYEYFKVLQEVVDDELYIRMSLSYIRFSE